MSAYNRPRRYPPAAPVPQPYASPPEPAAPVPAVPEPAAPVPAAPEPAAHEPVIPGPSAAQSRRGLLIGLGVLVAVAAAGLVVALVRGTDSTAPAAVSAPPVTTARTQATTARPNAPSTSSAAPAGVGSALEACTRLARAFGSLVAGLRPALRMPAGYVEPRVGTKVAVCVGPFRAAAGPGRGRLAYVAEYEQLPATQYALRLKTTGWVLAQGLPDTTYRDGPTTVTLVQRGTALVTLVGTGS